MELDVELDVELDAELDAKLDTDADELEARLENLLDVVTSLAALDFSKRAVIHGDGEFLDGLAYGLNVLSEELRASTVSRDHYDGIIRSMAEGLLVINGDLNITDINPALAQLLGYTEGELIGRPWALIYPPVADEKSAAPDTAIRIETEFYRADGSTVEVALSGSTLQRQAASAHSRVYVVQDITAQKELARSLAQARDAALHSASVTASFLANMSHEIRTPLNGVIGMAWLLLDSPEGDSARSMPPDARAKVETIHDCATLLLDIVNDILDLSKLESGKAELHIDEYPLARTIEDLLHVYAVRAEQKNLDLIGALDPTLPERVRVDVGVLRQVVGNLVSNAIKFTDTGEVVVAFRPIPWPGGGFGLRVEVRDSGIGVPANAQDTIFEAFRQASTGIASKYGGTGLGLAICKRLVELMGGHIGCHSTFGEGTELWFEVPCEPVQEVPSGTDGASLTDVPRSPFLDHAQVLIVDDNPHQRRALARSIEHWGGHPLEADSGPAALDLLSDLTSTPRFALIEVQLTGMNGVELARQFHDCGLTGGMEIILMTSLLASRSQAGLSRYGVVGSLPKPLKHSRLRTLLNARCERTRYVARRRLRPPTAPSVRDAHLLVVEDNPVNQAVLLGQLRRLGLTAQVASNGQEAVAAVSARRFSLVLMDLHMPVMDGYEATQQIRAHEHGVDLPIVAVTANATQQVRNRCFATGMDDFLSKPLRINLLSRSLTRWLSPVVDLQHIQDLQAAPAREELPSAPARASAHKELSFDKPLADGTPLPTRIPDDVHTALKRAVLARNNRRDPHIASRFGSAARVLVVDDNPVNRRVLAGMLGRLSVAVDEADDGQKAIAAVAGQRYHAIFMDVEMTGVDGLEAACAIRAGQRAYRTPIVAVTANDDASERRRCQAADMDDFLAKPVRIGELIARLALWLGPGEGSTLSRQCTIADRLLAVSPPSLAWLAPLSELAGSATLVADVSEFLARECRARLRRLRAHCEVGGGTASEDDGRGCDRASWYRDVYALSTWTANLGATRLAGVAATLSTCEPHERPFLLDLLDREIINLAQSLEA